MHTSCGNTAISAQSNGIASATESFEEVTGGQGVVPEPPVLLKKSNAWPASLFDL